MAKQKDLLHMMFRGMGYGVPDLFLCSYYNNIGFVLGKEQCLQKYSVVSNKLNIKMKSYSTTSE